jgi:hypothetical protein
VLRDRSGFALERESRPTTPEKPSAGGIGKPFVSAQGRVMCVLMSSAMGLMPFSLALAGFAIQ